MSFITYWVSWVFCSLILRLVSVRDDTLALDSESYLFNWEISVINWVSSEDSVTCLLSFRIYLSFDRMSASSCWISSPRCRSYRCHCSFYSIRDLHFSLSPCDSYSIPWLFSLSRWYFSPRFLYFSPRALNSYSRVLYSCSRTLYSYSRALYFSSKLDV